MPSRLCSRYILSSPPNQRSGQRGRNASIIATLIALIATTPLYWTMALRSDMKLLGWSTEGSAMSHSTLMKNTPPQMQA